VFCDFGSVSLSIKYVRGRGNEGESEGGRDWWDGMGRGKEWGGEGVRGGERARESDK